MDQSPNLALPYIMAAQAQKHITHNEAIRALDTLVHLAVLDRSLAAPPASPADGDRYIVAASPTGDWAGKTNAIAAYEDGLWSFHVPNKGWIAWVCDESIAVFFNGTSWTSIVAGGGLQGSFSDVGINASSDATNKLALSSTASLFNHAGASHQLKINKAAAANSASVLFQTGFSGRAEFGTTGDDDFHVKVSANGSAWNEAIVINRSTGAVSLPLTAASMVERIYITSATWTKPAGLKAVRVTVVGGGGGGGGCTGAASSYAVGGGGGGGGTSTKLILAATLGATEAVTVGAGGAAGANTGGTGGTGGTSSFGAHASATGGGGTGMATGTTALGVAGGLGGVGSLGTNNLEGDGGGSALRVSGTAGISGKGGASTNGGGGRGALGNLAGDPGGLRGGGGGGASTNSATAQAGGAGAGGVVIVEEFY